MNFPAPYVSRSGGRSKSASVFNEGIEVPKKEWEAACAKNPELKSNDRQERHAALKREILKGSLSKYRRR